MSQPPSGRAARSPPPCSITSQAIATQLGISARTVESYRAQLMEKLQLDSVASIVRLAVKLGRVTP